MATAEDAERAALESKVDALKGAANEAFKRGSANGDKDALQLAVKKYGQALKKAERLEEPRPPRLTACRVATLLANRCQAHLALGDSMAALTDAEAAVRAAPEWAKGYFRLGSVQMRRKAFLKAYTAFKQGWHLDTKNEELTKACQQAHQAMVGLDRHAADGQGGAAAPLMNAEELNALRAKTAIEEAQVRAARAEAAAAATLAATPVASAAYREEALARTRHMAAGGRSSDAAAEPPEAAEVAAEAAEVAEAAEAAEAADAEQPTPTPTTAVADASSSDAVAVASAAGRVASSGAAPAPEHELTRDETSLLLTAHLPLVAKMAQLDLALSSQAVSLQAEGLYEALEVQLPDPVDEEAASARFDKKARRLTVRLPLAARR